MEVCPFCDPMETLFETELVYVKYDLFPVSEGHMLIIPKRHVSDIFELTDRELEGIYRAIKLCKAIIEFTHKPDGYNIGINVGQAAGQTIPHAHVHVIPRYKGDVEDPRGGVRGVIPEKRFY